MPTRTPKYSCRDCWTGVIQMKKDQQNSNDKTLLGLKKRTPSNKPKEERILETVNRLVSRIQNDERKCLWRNTPTRPAWECLKFSETQWPPSVRNIRSMNQTSWDVQSLSSFRPTLTTRIMWTDSCLSDQRVFTDTTRILHIEKTPLGLLWCLFLYSIRRSGIICFRCVPYLQCVVIFWHYHGLFYRVLSTPFVFLTDTFSGKLN